MDDAKRAILIERERVLRSKRVAVRNDNQDIVEALVAISAVISTLIDIVLEENDK